MKTYALIFLALWATSTRAQNSLNAYKYVLVPEHFSFSKDNNPYGLSLISKLNLTDKGLIALREKDTLPQPVALDKCLALKMEIVERKTMFSTNLTIYLKDCQDNIIFKSKEGKSREKTFEESYPLALSDAFTSLFAIPYNYDSTLAGRPKTVPMAQPQQSATTRLPVENTATTPAATTPAATTGAATTPPPAPANLSATLYAQPLPNGYQLVDTTPKKVLTLLKTSVPDYFIAISNSSNGIVFKKDGAWYFEYYKSEQLVSQKLEVRF